MTTQDTFDPDTFGPVARQRPSRRRKLKHYAAQVDKSGTGESNVRLVRLDDSNHFSHPGHSLRRSHSGKSFGALFQGFIHESPVTCAVVDRWFNAFTEDVADTGEPMPSESVFNEAKRIAHRIRSQLPTTTDVYLMDGGKIAIELYGDFGHGFLLVCEPGGSALCIVTVDGVSRRARYENSSVLPDGFICEGLRDVLPVSYQFVVKRP